MANVVRDPKEHPDAILPDLTKKDPLVLAPAGSDWWTAFYPPDNMQRPTGPLSDGCHSVNYNVETKTVTEWNVGCESATDQTTFTHFPDGTAHKNRMRGNDFTSSLMYTHGVTCFTCHDVHGTANNADLLKPAGTMCLECHGPNSPNGPRAASIEQHTHHKLGSRGSGCVECHVPKIEQTIADVNVRAYTFRFVTPAMTAALKTWTNLSPWRMAN
jgi:predicted CXXCH cytochrome family protein